MISAAPQSRTAQTQPDQHYKPNPISILNPTRSALQTQPDLHAASSSGAQICQPSLRQNVVKRPIGRQSPFTADTQQGNLRTKPNWRISQWELIRLVKLPANSGDTCTNERCGRACASRLSCFRYNGCRLSYSRQQLQTLY